MKAFLLSLIVMGMMSSCMYSVTMAHTEGVASDLIDEYADQHAALSPTVSIPA